MRVVGHMVTRNEQDRWLRPCLERVVAQFGEVAVYDDASEDDTRDIAEECGAVVHRREHRDVPFGVNEGQFRADGWRWCIRALDLRPDDVVVVVDADEALVGVDPAAAIADLARHVNIEVGLRFKVHEVWGFDVAEPLVRVDHQWSKLEATRAGRAGWEPRFRERHTFGSGAVPGPKRTTVPLESVAVAHLGYATPGDRQTRYDRYRRADGHNAAHVETIRRSPTLAPLTVGDDRPFWNDIHHRWLIRTLS